MADPVEHLEEDHREHEEERHEKKAGADSKTPDGKKKLSQRHEVHLAVIIGLLGLVLTWIIFKRSSSSSAVQSGTAPGTVLGSTPASTTGTSAAGTATDPAAESAIQQLGTALGTLTGQVSTNQAQEAADVGGLTTGQNALGAQLTSAVSQQQAGNAGLSSLITSLGNEVTAIGSQPAYTAPATASGLPNSEAGAPPPLSADLQSALAKAGESIVSAVSDPAGGYLYLGSNGGIFNQDGSSYYGSYTGYPTSVQVQKPGSAVGLNVTPNGGYTEVFSSGATYAFGPGIYANQTAGPPIGTPATPS